MLLLCIDPGPTKSGFVLYDASERTVTAMGVLSNIEMLLRLRAIKVSGAQMIVEKVESYGKVVNADIFDTCEWSGRFIEAWDSTPGPVLDEPVLNPALRLTRKEVKRQLTGRTNTDDSDVGLALRVRFNEPPAPKHPKGKLKGVTSHIWAALALAVAWEEMHIRVRPAGWR